MHCNIHREPVELDERHNFPMLDDDKVYLDSSSTSFTPRVVIDSVNEYFNKYQANYNRGFNDLVTVISSKIDNVRKKVAEFIGAKQEEIIFTAGASFSSKMITNEIAIRELKTDDEVLLCRLDHSSTVTPWLELQELLKNFNVDIKIQDILIDLWGDYNEEDLISKVNDKTKYVVLTHIHNVYGLEMGIKQLTKDIRAKNPNVKIVLDASQSISHIDVNVVDLDVDYLYFSGHKMFAPTGIGVLYARGKSCKDFEDGTLNILGIIGLGSAIDYIDVGDFSKVPRVLIIMGIMFLVLSLFNLIQGLLSAKLSQNIVLKMRHDLFKKIINLPVNYFDKNSHGDIMSRMTNDVDNISNTLAQSLGSLFSGILMILGTAVMMFITCSRLALVSCVIVILTVFVTKFLSTVMKRFYKKRDSK